MKIKKKTQSPRFIINFCAAIKTVENAASEVKADGIKALTDYAGVGREPFVFIPRGENIDAHDFEYAIRPNLTKEQQKQLTALGLTQVYEGAVAKLHKAAGLKLIEFHP